MSDEKPAICSQSYPERCNFEQDTCNWYQDRTDDMEWTHTQGQSTFYLKVPGVDHTLGCLLYTSPSPRDLSTSRMPSSA